MHFFRCRFDFYSSNINCIIKPTSARSYTAGNKEQSARSYTAGNKEQSARPYTAGNKEQN